MYTVTFFRWRNGPAHDIRHYGRSDHAAWAAKCWASRGLYGCKTKLRKTVDFNQVNQNKKRCFYSVHTQRWAVVSRKQAPVLPPPIERRYWLRASVEEGRWLSAASLAEAWRLQQEWSVSGPIYYGPEGMMDEGTTA